MTDKALSSPIRILIADDERSIRMLLDMTLRSAGFNPVVAANGDEAVELMNEDIDAVVLDLKMPGKDGMACLKEFQRTYPETQVIILTGSTDINEAVDAMKNGAFDYVTKPFNREELAALVGRAARTTRLEHENKQLRHALAAPETKSPFVGKSRWARQIQTGVERIAQLDSTVLITGESGVGKGLLARMIHYEGPNAGNPFVTVNCTALPRELVESELFGHEKGSFTGAHERRMGRVEMADGGTLFLDEVGDMPLELQPKLLTFLQERVFQRVGGNQEIDVNVRVIAATNQDLQTMVRAKTFREDLYFRLNVLPIRMPPLRERLDDVPVLAQHILGRIAQRRKSEPYLLDSTALERLRSYAWPGNVRELENVLERATAFCMAQTLKDEDFPAEVFNRRLQEDPGESESAQEPMTLAGKSLSEIEKLALIQTLEMCEGNKACAARILEISEKSIYNKMKRLGVTF